MSDNTPTNITANNKSNNSSSSDLKLLSNETNAEISLPHNIIAEQEVLGGLLHDNNNLNKVREVLSVADFYEPTHGKIYETIIKLIDRGRIADPISISSNFPNDKGFIEIKGVNYLRTIVADYLVGVSDLKERAETIKDLAQKRLLINVLMGNVRDVVMKTQTDVKTAEQIEKIETELFAITAGSAKIVGGFVTLKQALAETRRRMELAKLKGGVSGIDTGFYELNDKIHGWQDSDLIIVAGRPSMGKTSFAMSIAMNAARAVEMTPDYQENKKGGIGIFSLEMSSDQLSAKLLSMHTGTPVSELVSGKIDQMTLNNIIEKIPEIDSMPIYIDDTPALGIGALRTRARRLKQRHGLNMLIVDYLQLLRGSGRDGGNRVQEVSEITQGLKAIAKELNIPVIALSQLSRGVESRDDKHPQLSDLRESGSIEQDADIVLFLYRESYYISRKMPPEPPIQPDNYDMELQKKNPQALKYRDWEILCEQAHQAKNKAEVIIAKHRNGEIGTALLRFDEETTRFENLAIEYES